MVEQVRDNAMDYLAKKLPDDSDQVVLAIAKTMLAKAAGPVQMKLEALRVASLTEDHRMQEAEAYNTCGCFSPFEGLTEEKLDEMIKHNFATVTKKDDLKALANQARKVSNKAGHHREGQQVAEYLKSGDKEVSKAPDGLKALLVRVGRQAERFYLGDMFQTRQTTESAMTSWSSLFGSKFVHNWWSREFYMESTREQEREMGLRRSYTHLRDEALAMLGGEGLKSWFMKNLPKDTPRDMKQLLLDLAFQIGENGLAFFKAKFFVGVPRGEFDNSRNDFGVGNLKTLVEFLVAQAADSAGPWSATMKQLRSIV